MTLQKILTIIFLSFIIFLPAIAKEKYLASIKIKIQKPATYRGLQ
jgi:hypothetical protein